MKKIVLPALLALILFSSQTPKTAEPKPMPQPKVDPKPVPPPKAEPRAPAPKSNPKQEKPKPPKKQDNS